MADSDLFAALLAQATEIQLLKGQLAAAQEESLYRELCESDCRAFLDESIVSIGVGTDQLWTARDGSIGKFSTQDEAEMALLERLRATHRVFREDT